MKKVYEKPRIIFESFNLDNSIAGDCERIVGNPTKGSCGVPGSDGTNLFSGNIAGCDFDWNSMVTNESERDQYDGFCYHVPTEAFTLFNS